MRLQVRLSPDELSGNNPGQVVHIRMPLFTKQYNLVLVKVQVASFYVTVIKC